MRDFAAFWTLDRFRPQYDYPPFVIDIHSVIAAYFFMDNSADTIFILDNLLYTYFLLLLSYLSRDNTIFSKGYSITASFGFYFGMIQFIASTMVSRRSRFVTWLVSK